MTDLDDWLRKPPRRASDPEREKFVRAFGALLEREPDRAPGPRALADAMGWSNANLNGRVTGLRRRLLVEAGFRQDERTSRWVKR